ncbi:MAG: efflux transporter outer membrane subunit [Pseudomonadota bacterium]
MFKSLQRVAPRLLPFALVGLAGCSLIPNYERPDTPLPQAWPGGAIATAAATSPAAPAADVPWQNFFTDPRLQQLIGIALANNRDLRLAMLNVEQVRAQYQIRRADQFPTLNAAATGSRVPNGNSGTTSIYNVGLAVTAFELDFFGRIASLKEAALSQYLASEESRKTAQISLIATVATTWLNLLADEALLDVTRQTVATREESLRLTKLRFDNGASSELDFRQSESLSESAKVVLAQLQRQRALDENAMVLLLGQALPAGLDLREPVAGLNGAMAPGDLPAGLPSDLLANRPDIRAAEQQLLAANANIGAARAAFFPRITLTTGIGTASNQLSGLFESGTFGWTFAPQLLLPIFDAGRNQASLDSATVGRDIAIAQYEKAIQTAFREVADALAGRATLVEQLRAQQAQANAESVRFRLADLRFQNGIASSLDLLDAQRSLFTAQQAVLQTRLLQLQNQVALYKTLGGGWTETRSAGTP